MGGGVLEALPPLRKLWPHSSYTCSRQRRRPCAPPRQRTGSPAGTAACNERKHTFCWVFERQRLMRGRPAQAYPHTWQPHTYSLRCSGNANASAGATASISGSNCPRTLPPARPPARPPAARLPWRHTTPAGRARRRAARWVLSRSQGGRAWGWGGRRMPRYSRGGGGGQRWAPARALSSASITPR